MKLAKWKLALGAFAVLTHLALLLVASRSTNTSRNSVAPELNKLDAR